MNVYNAILRAADHIERHPHTFNFRTTSVPGDCGSPGCAIGWIGFFAGAERGRCIFGVQETLGCEDTEFYKRMRDLHNARGIDGWWNDTPEFVAFGLRQYAKKYHAEDAQDDGEAFKRFLASALPLEQGETCAQRSAS